MLRPSFKPGAANATCVVSCGSAAAFSLAFKPVGRLSGASRRLTGTLRPCLSCRRAYRPEFGKFGGVLDKVRKKLQAASSEMEQAGVRTRAIERRLRGVRELPAADAQRHLAVEGLVVSEAVDDEDRETGTGTEIAAD